MIRPFFDATLQIGVGKPEGDAEIPRDRALGQGAVLVNGVQETERDLGLVVERPRFEHRALKPLAFRVGHSAPLFTA